MLNITKYGFFWQKNTVSFFFFLMPRKTAGPCMRNIDRPAASNAASLPNFFPKNAVSRRVPNLRKMN